MKKLFVCFAGVLIAVLALTGCTGNNDDLDALREELRALIEENRCPCWDPWDGGDYDFGFGGDDGWVWDPGELFGSPAPELIEKVNAMLVGATGHYVEDWEVREQDFYRWLFIDYIPGTRGVSQQAMINVIPHMVILIELPEDADTAAVAAQILANTDPNRWICTGAEAHDVFYSGRYIVKVMSDNATVSAIRNNYAAVLG